MTVYAKIENNKLICASNNLGITGLADSPELCLANGFTAYTEEQVSGYFAETHQIIDGVLMDITNTAEYVAEQKIKNFQSDIQYQHDSFNEYAREIVYQIQYNTALSNTTLILNLEEQLQTEQQAVIARINAITEAYNNAST